MLSLKKTLILSVITPTLLFCSNTYSAEEMSQLELLKTMPANQYDVGVLQLRVFSALLTQNLHGEKIKGTKFRFDKARLRKNNGRLSFQMLYEGKSKYITQEHCGPLEAITGQFLSPRGMAESMSSELTSVEYHKLEENLEIRTVMIDKDNPKLMLECIL